jgi:hypothetical protein
LTADVVALEARKAADTEYGTTGPADPNTRPVRTRRWWRR